MRGGSAFATVGRDDEGVGIEQVIGDEPTPLLATVLAEDFRHLLDGLDDAQLKAIALAKLEGYDNQEIAARLGCALRTVERRLELIRRKWERHGGDDR